MRTNHQDRVQRDGGDSLSAQFNPMAAGAPNLGDAFPPPMKASLLPLLLLAAGSLPVAGQTVLARWDFNGGNDGDVATGTLEPVLGAGTAQTVNGVTGAFATGSVGDPAAGDNSGWELSAFPVQGVGERLAGAGFAAPTTGHQDIRLQFDWRPSDAACRNLVVLYTVDGSSWAEITSFTSDQAGAWITGKTVDFSSARLVNDNPLFAVRLVSDFGESLEYEPANPDSAYHPDGAWRFDLVTVLGTPTDGGPTAPAIATQPQSQSRFVGEDAAFSVAATGTAPLGYQWYHDGEAIPEATAATLELTAVTFSDAGAYRVVVANERGEISSAEVTLLVAEVQPPELTGIATLRGMIDPDNFEPTDTVTRFTVEGVVTTHCNLTVAPNVLFYVQDATAGIAVFWRGGAGRFLPAAGDRVRVTARLEQFRGLLELTPDASDPETAVLRLSTGNPLPEPVPLDFSWLNDPLTLEPFEGSCVIAGEVRIERLTPTFPATGSLWLTNGFSEVFTLFVNAQTDLGGQPKPVDLVSVVGVLAQFDSSAPYTGGYQIIPSRLADIISDAKPPTVWFTNVLANLTRPGDAPENTFTEHGLRPGETLTTTFFITDPEGRPVTIEAETAGLPASAQWDFPDGQTADLTGAFTWSPTPDDAGRLFEATLHAWNVAATNTVTLTLYCPTAAEQQVAITEYLANPTDDPEAAFFNPLQRNPAVGTEPWILDEYLELANLSDETLDLFGWTMADGVGIRHRFYSFFPLGAKSAIVLYGGPLNGFPPILDVMTEPASEGGSGLALNNGGDLIIIRNELGGIVERVVYPAEQVSADGSMTRFPTLNGPFRPQTTVADRPVSPGRQYDGKFWNEPATIPPADIGRVTARRNPDGSVILAWAVDPGQTYSVEAAPAVTGPFAVIAAGLTRGESTDAEAATADRRFYRIRSP